MQKSRHLMRHNALKSFVQIPFALPQADTEVMKKRGGLARGF